MSVQHKRLQQQVDQLRAELASAKGLLARIHRDGGHHTEAVGVARSIADAHNKVSEWLLAADERDALAADNKRLRKLLKALREEVSAGCAEDAPVEELKPGIDFEVVLEVDAVLAATPSQSLDAHDAALLREVADCVGKIAVVPTIDTPQSMRDLIADAIRAKADRIEQEAANGKA